MKVDESCDGAPNNVKDDVVPEVAFERAPDDQGNCAGKVHKIENRTLEGNDMKHGQTVCGQDRDRSVPLDEV